MNKLLIICGPTATGKTKLALELAQKLNGELVSSDSRQIYRGLDFLTGKDLPNKLKVKSEKLKVKFKDYTYSLKAYVVGGVPLWLYDVVEPGEEFSVAHYQCLAKEVISDIHKRGKLPIVVGGTGLYIASLTRPFPLINVPPNKALRRRLAYTGVVQLRKELRQADPLKWEKMNDSDRQNPRRLVRAIEIALFHKQGSRKFEDSKKTFPALWIGLTGDFPTLKNRIEARVVKRWAKAVVEVKAFKNTSAKPTPQVASVLGMPEINRFLNGQLTHEVALKAWVASEWAYARRQLTWFKKEPSIHWFDITCPNYQKEIVTQVAAWYTKS